MFSNPQKVVHALGISPGMIIADLGSGSGEYSLACAKAIGYSGHVYAIDVQKDLLSKLKKAALSQGTGAVEIVWGDIEKQGGSGLSDASVDVSLLANILFQVEDKKQVIAEAARITRPNGSIAVVDWQDSFGGLGPRPEDVVSVNDVVVLFRERGYKKVSDFKAGDHHYGLIFKKEA